MIVKCILVTIKLILENSQIEKSFRYKNSVWGSEFILLHGCLRFTQNLQAAVLLYLAWHLKDRCLFLTLWRLSSYIYDIMLTKEQKTGQRKNKREQWTKENDFNL